MSFLSTGSKFVALQLSLVCLLFVAGCGTRRGTTIIVTDAGPDTGHVISDAATTDGTASGDIHVSRTPALTIPDNSDTGVSDIAVATGTCTIAAISVDLTVTHQCDSDLVIDLTSPNGTNVVLRDAVGMCMTGFTDHYMSGGTTESPIDGFIGQPASGNWILRVVDNFGSDTGTFDSWALSITCAR